MCKFRIILTEVPYNTWWVDYGVTAHISNSMQGFLTIQTLNPNENFIFIGNRVKAPVEAVENFRLILDTGYCLDLFQTLYVPSCSRNLVSISKLDRNGFFIKFGNGCFSLYKNTSFVGFGILIGELYNLKLNNRFAETLLTLHHNVGTKRSLNNENSSFLWHKRLGHISKESLEKLVKNEILPNLDFTNLSVCV